MKRKEIVIIAMLVLIAATMGFLWGFSQKISDSIEISIDQSDKAKKECRGLGGEIINDDNILYPLSFECVDYDEEGYMFYWHKSENEEYYKTRK